MDALDYPFFQRALIAGLLASLACGVMGTFVVVKRISSISGGLSHAAFGGVGLGYLLGFSPTLGATGFAVIAGLGIGFAYRRLRSGLDTLIAIVWALGMALGILFVSLAPGYAPDLLSYLFGSILFVPPEYLLVIALLDAIILGTVALLFKEFQAVAFDEEYAEVMGIPTERFVLLLMVLVSLSIVALIRVVGVILVIALLTIPAAVARHWSQSLARMMVLASALGAACCTGGLFLSFWISDRLEVNVPTGPLIIIISVVLFGVSAILRGRPGPKRP